MYKEFAAENIVVGREPGLLSSSAFAIAIRNMGLRARNCLNALSNHPPKAFKGSLQAAIAVAMLSKVTMRISSPNPPAF